MDDSVQPIGCPWDLKSVAVIVDVYQDVVVGPSITSKERKESRGWRTVGTEMSVSSVTRMQV